MDAELLARLQFATTVGVHWLFVLLTLGLAPLVAIMHSRYALTGKPIHERMTRFWGQIYVVNYVLGIAAGLVMEFQFGLAWPKLTAYAGNVIGGPMALETLIAFFAESTFLGLWIFGWGRLPKALHVATIWLVTLTAYASAFWILLANGFMQHPVGHVVRDGVAYLTDFGAVLANPNALNALQHVVMAGLLAGGLFLTGVSCYHLLRRTAEHEFFRSSLRLGLLVSVLSGYLTVHLGFLQIPALIASQPMKVASLRGHMEDEDVGDLTVAAVQSDMVAAHGPGDYAPPAWIGYAFDAMQYPGFIMVILSGAMFLLLYRDWLLRLRPLMYLGLVLLPLPFAASAGGWLVREVGRQPWVVYGELRTADALSGASPTAILLSYILFAGLLIALAIADWTLIARYARRGPREDDLGRPVADPVPQPGRAF